MRWGKLSGFHRGACILVLASWVGGFSAAAFGQAGTGTVRGTLQYEDGRPLPGVWVIIQNAEIGINYKKDSNPRGQFEFSDVFPGAYSFTISPGHFVVRSPLQIRVRAGEELEVTVVVARTARHAEPDSPSALMLRLQ